MTSCTYIYFTAITFYSYYECSTFIFISYFRILFLRAFFFLHSFRGRYFSFYSDFNLYRYRDVQRDFCCFNRCKRFFLSVYRILFLACVNSACWLWSPGSFSTSRCQFFCLISDKSLAIQWNDNLLKITIFALIDFGFS